ncbi:hypothetical protein QIA17_00895 [Borreliella californiensis]|uniref:Uncharacterized protein n=1 Tax=Borreliella californiensis TaxID=373543 RepID=A0A7W9ZLD8_9SPIR|nr:hypothetical protein [Borreliella californiensis]MBB6213290.1 hypothetical protein [Borreliella californiensis]WKC91394.1 hypothetical protein QIA17_00895 [Borreliella californiensis]WNY70148.1 hypothetical protein QIA39_00360 [Borreliella californiensis]
MTSNLITCLIINNLTLIHFVGFEDIKIKNNVSLIKKYIIITITSLLIYSMSFYLYKQFTKNNLLFLMPIFYVILIYMLISSFKVLNDIFIVYNKKSNYSNDFMLSNNSLIAITFFALDKNNGFFEGLEILILSALGILIALMSITSVKKNFDKNPKINILGNESIYFFIMFILSLIPNIIILIYNQ